MSENIELHETKGSSRLRAFSRQASRSRISSVHKKTASHLRRKSLGGFRKQYARSKSTLQLLHDSKEDKSFFSCNFHWIYQWICLPYQDIWFPYPSKSTLKKTLNRLDFNSFDPFDLFEDFYYPFWTWPGLIFSLGCAVLLVIYSIFAITTLVEDNRTQQDYFKLLNNDELYTLPQNIGLSFVDINGKTDLNSSYFDTNFDLCTKNANGTICTPKKLQLCSISNTIAICLNSSETFFLKGTENSEEFQYGIMRLSRCDPEFRTLNSLQNCASTDEIYSKFKNAKFKFLVSWSTPTTKLPFVMVKDFSSVINTTILVDGFFSNVQNEFPSRVLRETAYESYISFERFETFYTTNGTSKTLFEMRLKMNPSVAVTSFIGKTILDTGSSIGGIFMLCKLVGILISMFFVKEAFMQLKNYRENPEIVKILLEKKRKELQHLKDTLLLYKVKEPLRMEDDDLYAYLNVKRDTEITTFRTSLFNTLCTKNQEDKLSSSESKIEADLEIDEFQKKRSDEMIELVRADERDRMPDPQLPRTVNVLALEDICKQVKVLEEFVKDLASNKAKKQSQNFFRKNIKLKEVK